ncbi:MAG: Asp-tRNA(Asn)/Glu-tRNA(Gln) amidotransferase subunit GatB [Phycisphaerae bacterium]
MIAAEMDIRPIIGLEIHVQLATRTKMFCGCPVEFAAQPNSRVCPVCLGLPGTLPVINRRACELAVKAGLALGCRVADFTKWDRKSYYYPDMPKNYQISQYDLPLSHDGRFEIPLPDGSLKPVGIIRAHLEEDAGKSLHEGLNHTRVDLNRAGTPLLEIVTRPDLDNADATYTFCVELQRLVRYLGISEADMQKGHMRFEPNVNVAITCDGVEYRTPISEIKNLNSFRSVRGAIRYEVERQVREWEADHTYTLDTRGKINLGWDDEREVTEFQRAKEESHDYRYFPDPDLVPMRPDAAWIDALRGQIGELPVTRRRRFMSDHGMSEGDCDVILADRETGDLYDEAVAAGADAGTLTKQFVGIWNRLASASQTSVGRLGVDAERVADLAKIVAQGVVSATAAAQIADETYKTKDDPTRSAIDIARGFGLIQERDESALQAWVDEAFANHPHAVDDAMKNPKKAHAAVGFLRGQVMKLSKGKADPRLAGKMIEQKLGRMSNP